MRLKIRHIGLVGIFILLISITPSFAIDEKNRNMFLIYAMYLTPFLALIYKKGDASIDITLFLLGGLMFVVPLAFHPDAFRYSTVLYGWLFFMFFSVYIRVLKGSSFTATDFGLLLRGIILAYFVTLVIQQICVFTGLPIFNVAAYNSAEPWKLNSLSPEPSHTARIMSLLLFFYVKVILLPYPNANFSIVFKIIDKKVLYCYLYCILTMGSALGFLLLILLMLQFMPKKRVVSYCISVILILGIFFVLFKDNPVFQRSVSFIINVIDYDENALIDEDLSAAQRIIPSVHGWKAIDFISWDSIWGHGIDADEGLTPLPSIDCGAGSFSIWYNYGFIISMIFWTFSYKICHIKNDVVCSTTYWILLVFFYGGINNPMIWFTLLLFYTYKYFYCKQVLFAYKNSYKKVYSN